MKKLLLVTAFILAVATSASGQDALSIIKGQIGDLVVNNANLTGQLNAAITENKSLKEENTKLQDELQKLKPLDASANPAAKPTPPQEPEKH